MTDKDIVICGHGGHNPSTKNMYTYCESNYNSYSQNGKRRELIVVRRPKKLTDELRVKFHDTYKTILGRNIYSQGTKRQYVYKKYTDGNYYSDCSSSGMATLNEIGINIPLYSTAGIYTQNDNFETVPVKIVNGHVTNPEILKVGDCLEFVREDVNRPLQIGHVEYVYEINNNSAPTKKDLIKRGQEEAVKFTGVSKINGKNFDIDGIRGDQTRQMAGIVLATALVKDNNNNYSIQKGDKSYLVTAVEILQYMLGHDANGVEYAGVFGNGLEKAVGSSVVTPDMIMSYLK